MNFSTRFDTADTDLVGLILCAGIVAKCTVSLNTFEITIFNSILIMRAGHKTVELYGNIAVQFV